MPQQTLNYGNDPNDGTGDALRDAAIKIDANFTELYVDLYRIMSTGLLHGGIISINSGDNTTIDVTSGHGILIDAATDIDNPTLTDAQWADLTAVPITNITTQIVTYIAVAFDGTLEQFSNPLTDQERREHIFLGVVVHSNKTNINVVNNIPIPVINSVNQLHDFMTSTGRVNNGNTVTNFGTNLTITKSAGTLTGIGLNYRTSKASPSTVILSSQSQPTFRYRLNNSVEYLDTQNIDPNNYDLAGVLTAVPNNKYSIQRLYLFPSNIIRIQYGQEVYNSKSEALQGIRTETFITEDNIKDNATLIGLLVIKQNTTNLSNIDNAQFLSVSKFGDTNVAASGVSTSTLQNAYTNSSQPEITLDATRGGVDVVDNASPISGSLLKLSNNAQTDTYFSVDSTKTQIKKLNLGTPTELTIATGIISITRSYHTVDTEADAITDDLNTINGGTVGDILLLQSAALGRTVVLKDNVGNLSLEGDFSLNHTSDKIMLMYTASSVWEEISRTSNA